MTHDEIFKLNDNELKSEIIKKIGWFYRPDFFDPTKNISDAFRIIEKFEEMGYGVFTTNRYSHSPEIPQLQYGVSLVKRSINVVGYGKTLPLAICRAALLAVQSASPTHYLP